MAASKEIRLISALCETAVHGYCITDVMEKCGCDCHFEVVTRHKTLTDLAYVLWRLDAPLDTLKETAVEKSARVKTIVEAFATKHDLAPFGVEGFIEIVRPIMDREYWSLREAQADFDAWSA